MCPMNVHLLSCLVSFTTLQKYELPLFSPFFYQKLRGESLIRGLIYLLVCVYVCVFVCVCDKSCICLSITEYLFVEYERIKQVWMHIRLWVHWSIYGSCTEYTYTGSVSKYIEGGHTLECTYSWIWRMQVHKFMWVYKLSECIWKEYVDVYRECMCIDTFVNWQKARMRGGCQKTCILEIFPEVHVYINHDAPLPSVSITPKWYRDIHSDKTTVKNK